MISQLPSDAQKLSHLLQLEVHRQLQPDTATTDWDLETIHYEWSWDLNTLSPKYHTEAFENIIIHLQNLSTISLDNINKAVEEAMAKSQGDNKTVQDYFNDLDNIKHSETNLTFTNSTIMRTLFADVIFVSLTQVAIQSCYCMFKICFTSSHNIKPLFPTYKPREWTGRSCKPKQRGTPQ